MQCGWMAAITQGRASRAAQARRLAFGASLACVCALLTSCADCFFNLKGHVVECGTTTPVPGARISVHIDDGIHGMRTLATTFTTDAAGAFKVSTDGSEVCSATATLTVTKDGFDLLQKQFQGVPKSDAEVCMTRRGPATGP